MAHRIALISAALALVLAASAVLAASPAHYPHLAIICPGPSSPVDGTPAIRPRNDCTPAFSEQDVRSYLAAHLQLALPNVTAVVRHPQIVSIRFLGLRDLSREPYALAWLVPTDRIVCYVVLLGTFFPLHGPPHHPLLHFPRPVFIVFDAHSGNLLGTGFGDPLGP
jgi:hypothetical protein